MRIKQQITSGEMPLRGLQDNQSPTLPFRQSLINLLERQSIDAAQRGGEQGAKLYREAQYLMVALADEIFLHLLEWQGNTVWQNLLLEFRLFNSRAAGQRVFENIEVLLRNRDPITVELAHLYLIVLTLGFQGKYRDTPDVVEVQHYRQRLFQFIAQRDPTGLYDYLHHDQQKRLFPDSYAYTLETDKEKHPWLAPVYRWYLLFGAAVLILLISSTLLWYAVTDDIELMTKEVLGKNRIERFKSTTETTTTFATSTTEPLVTQPTSMPTTSIPITTTLPNTVTLGDLVFASGSTQLMSDKSPELDKLAELLRNNPNKSVRIEGHTDNKGSKSRNQDISYRRAQAVSAVLQKRGINISRIRIAGYGDTRPLTSNATEEGRKKNRRVEIIITD